MSENTKGSISRSLSRDRKRGKQGGRNESLHGTQSQTRLIDNLLSALLSRTEFLSVKVKRQPNNIILLYTHYNVDGNDY